MGLLRKCITVNNITDLKTVPQDTAVCVVQFFVSWYVNISHFVNKMIKC